MSLRRKLNAEGISHAHADSPTHARHVAERKLHRSREWIPEEVDNRSAEVFRLRSDSLSLGVGSYFIHDGKSERSASGQEFEDHCNSINWARRWHYAKMRRHGKECTVRRKRKSPACCEIVVNLAPWQMLWINSELSAWENAGLSSKKRSDLLESLINELRQGVVQEFRDATGWDAVASYAHYDSNKIHVAVIATRVGKDNTPQGSKQLGTVGAWSVGQHRIAKLGLAEEGDHRLRENLEKFKRRFGESRQPLDIRLHNRLDSDFEAIVGKADRAKQYESAKKAYAGWKARNRQESVQRSPSAQRIAWQTLRLVSPLLPPPLRAVLSVARTASQALQVVCEALNSLSPQPTVASPAKVKAKELVL